MVNDPDTGVLTPFNFDQILNQVPELNQFGYNLSTHSFTTLIDSSNLNIDVWIDLANIIKDNYEKYDGFVILHGTDTMAFSASALSFILEDLQKPVIFTGSQLPIGTLRTDGKENIISAIEIAAASKNDQAMVPEVCIYFENKLFRGNRTTKHNAEYFNAFESPNYPCLAEAGINIKYNYGAIHYPTIKKDLSINTNLNSNIVICKIFPGMTKEVLHTILNIDNNKAVIIETYGAGNAPTSRWFIDEIESVIKKGKIVLNITQCNAGSVDMSKYETGNELSKTGVISGYDITTEAAVTKLMCLLGQYSADSDIIKCLEKPLKGEMTKQEVEVAHL